MARGGLTKKLEDSGKKNLLAKRGWGLSDRFLSDNGEKSIGRREA